jgi:hypothetical protein
MMTQQSHDKDLPQVIKANDPFAYNFEFELSFTLPHSFHYYVNISEVDLRRLEWMVN